MLVEAETVLVTIDVSKIFEIVAIGLTSLFTVIQGAVALLDYLNKRKERALRATYIARMRMTTNAHAKKKD